MTDAKDLGPLDWRIAIVDKTGRPTQEFQRRWATQRANNALIGTVTFGMGPPSSLDPADGAFYVDTSQTPAVLYVGRDDQWVRVGVFDFTQLADVPHTYAGANGQLVRVNSGGTALVFGTLVTADIPLLLIGFGIGTGATGTNVATPIAAPRAGTLTSCKFVTQKSDASTDLTFKVKKNGTDIFVTDPTVTHGTSPGTISSFTITTTAVAQNDVFTVDITTGTSSWMGTIQLEP